MKFATHYDRWLGGVLLVLVAILFADTFTFQTRPQVPLNTAFWPRVILVLLAATAIVLVFRGRVTDEPAEAFRRSAGVVFTGSAVFVAAIFYGGFVASALLVATTGFFWLSDKHDAKTAVISLVYGSVVSGSVYFLFRFALKVHLPEGEFF